MGRRLVHLMVGAACLAPWQPARGQVRVDLFPSVGGYFSFTTFQRELAQSPGVEAGRGSQGPAFAVGAEVTGWWSRRFGMALHGQISGSDPSYTALGSEPDQPDGRVTIYGAKLLLAIPGSAPSRTAYVTVGPSIVHRSGEAFDDLAQNSSVAATLGLGSYYRLNPRVSLRGELSGLLYRLRLKGGEDYVYPASTQVDLTVRLGVGFHLTEDEDEEE